MKILARLAFSFALLFATHATALEAGDRAPAFSMQGSDGKTYASSDLAGKRGYVLAWFPKAFTPGCTAELEDLRDNAAALDAYDAAVFMVSFDTPERNAEFAKSLGTAQVLLSDADGSVAQAYGVAGESAAFPKRWTIYVDKDGVVRDVDTSVDTSTAGADIARRLGELGFPKK
jgi:peroxiredoxin Q/BCP